MPHGFAGLARWLGLVVLVVPATVAVALETSRGEYLFQAAGCLACHTAKDDAIEPLAGGHEFKTPFGTFYSPNITPHPTRGIGRWTFRDFDNALRRGRAPDGSAYYPVFPYTSYAKITEADSRHLFEYLKSRPVIARANQAHQLKTPFRWRWVNRVWQALFFEPGAFVADTRRDEQWNRGAYLSTALAHCGECHSPRGLGGAVDTARHLAGNPQGPDGGYVPNITPHPSADIAEWVEIDLLAYMEDGQLPDGDYAGGAMVDVIDNGLSKLTAQDRKAIAQYIMSLRPLPSTASPSSSE